MLFFKGLFEFWLWSLVGSKGIITVHRQDWSVIAPGHSAEQQGRKYGKKYNFFHGISFCNKKFIIKKGFAEKNKMDTILTGSVSNPFADTNQSRFNGYFLSR